MILPPRLLPLTLPLHRHRLSRRQIQLVNTAITPIEWQTDDEDGSDNVTQRDGDDGLVDELADGEGGAALHHANGDEEEVCDAVLVAEDDEGPGGCVSGLIGEMRVVLFLYDVTLDLFVVVTSVGGRCRYASTTEN